MLSFLRFLLPGLFFPALLLCLGMVLFGQLRQQPHEELAYYGYGRCELPCWTGITTGITRPDQVEALIKAGVPALQSARRVYQNAARLYIAPPETGQEGQFVAALYHNLDTILEVYLSGFWFPPEGWQYLPGRPACVLLFPPHIRRVDLVWMQNGLSIALAFRDTGLEELPHRPYARVEMRVIAVPMCKSPGAVDWHGFAPLWYYRRILAQQDNRG